MTDTIELKPCPFCGERIDPPRSRQSSSDRSEGFVAFAKCFCGGYSATAHRMGQGDTESEAIRDAAAKWNHRAQPASRQTHKGHVLSAFEKRVGMTLGEWLKENAHRYTIDEAAAEIGYSRAEMLRKYAPGAPFRRRPKSHSREVSEAAERAGLPAAAVLSRLRRGWTMGDALSTPVRIYKPARTPS